MTPENLIDNAAVLRVVIAVHGAQLSAGGSVLHRRGGGGQGVVLQRSKPVLRHLKVLRRVSRHAETPECLIVEFQLDSIFDAISIDLRDF